ncbi:MATE family efflux transporter [Roseburia sp. AM16-25]|mgnify:FL=1|uniref:MATE family efflux transporter n=1 Tax=Roseburia sp. AM16-25 TaxID=2292065 RepID=UPI000E53AD0A|nr:MATE family efflux transporter [Roseburia sp. AM16-25]RHO31855.1 MATE family efflux transporter [Roseburia sp. AM16-25]
MKIQLSEHFTYSKLLRFTFPSIIMMIFTSIYSVIDGLFVSNFAGKTALAAINIIYPFIMAVGALGFMMGTGGSALVGRLLGEGEKEKANKTFSLIVYTTAIAGILLSALAFLLVPTVSRLFGASGQLLDYCILYGRICFLSMPCFMLQNVFQCFFITAEKPRLGLDVVLSAGITNMVLDFLFVAVFGLGLKGAAIATVCGEIIGGLVPILYFAGRNHSLLRLGRTSFDAGSILKTCTNGSSELMTELSSSVVTVLYNTQLMKIAGENGVAAYSTIMYVNFIFVAIFLGYSLGSAPIISFHYGAGNHDELKNMRKKSLRLIAVWGIGMTIISHIFALPFARFFVGYDSELLAMTIHGFRIYAFVYLLNGFNIFGSSFFTALNNGMVSATISFLRTLVFEVICILLLPVFFGIDGIWSAVLVAEALALCVTSFFLITKRSRYHY